MGTSLWSISACLHMQHLYFTTFLEEQQKFSGSLKFSLWFMVPPENNQCPEKQGRSFYQAVINKVKFEPVLKNVRRLSPKFCLQVYIKNLLSPYLLPPLSCKLYETLMGHHFFFFFLSFLVKVRGVWSVPLKTMVIFSLSSVGACISLQRPPEHVSSGGGPNCFDSTKFQ